jgi:hypothetical protein
MATTAGALLAVYLLAVLYALLSPVKQRDPAMGAAQGCLFGLVLLLVVLAILLAIGIRWQLRWLVVTLFVITIAPPAWVMLGTPVYIANLRKRKRENARWNVEALPPPVPPAETGQNPPGQP